MLTNLDSSSNLKMRGPDKVSSFLLGVLYLRYHYEKPSIYLSRYGRTYKCNHPVYDICTLYIQDDIGLAVIQQRYDISTKSTWWSEIDEYLIDDIYLNPNFYPYFKERAKNCTDGLYPTVTIRQIMWALKMKPLPRQRWETCFDRRFI